MLYSIQKAFENNDPQLAVKTYRKDKPINKNTQRSNSRAVNWINKNPEDTRNVIFVLDIISEVERIGDLIKNISDGIVFYYEAYSIKEGRFPLT
jgi:phosphate transport system protein